MTNEIFQHLNQPKFIVCPTQYCSARATPNVRNSEYLNTLGSKLASEVDIMWTGKFLEFPSRMYEYVHRNSMNIHLFNR